MRKKSGFTLMEVMLVIAMFSTAAVVISTVFFSNVNRIEAQGKETFLHEEIDRGITRLSDRLKGTCKIIGFDELNSDNNVLLKFEYYYRDADKAFVGTLYLEEKDNQKVLKLKSIKDSKEEINTIMSYVDDFKVDFMGSDGSIVINEEAAKALRLTYEVSTKYRKIQKRKKGQVVIKLRNIGE